MITKKARSNGHYARWVRSLPSVLSLQKAEKVQRLVGHGLEGANLEGCLDYLSFPLTRDEYEEFHNIGWQGWEAKYGEQWRYVSMTLLRAIQEGVLKFKRSKS